MMYQHDQHRKTFGNEQILQHNLPEDYVEKEVQPKIITNPALRNRVVQPKKGNQETSVDIAQRISNKIVARGAQGIAGLCRSFRIMDKNRNGTLEYDEVKRAMYAYHIATTDREIQAMFEIFDTNQDGKLNFREFVREIVGPMSPRRTELAKQAFKKLDINGDGVIDI